jgi:Secretion system C-terminal sorting domain
MKPQLAHSPLYFDDIHNQTTGDLFITDLSGRILIQKNISTINSKSDLTLNEITSGVYLVIFNSDNGKTCKKMVVSK